MVELILRFAFVALSLVVEATPPKPPEPTVILTPTDSAMLRDDGDDRR